MNGEPTTAQSEAGEKGELLGGPKNPTTWVSHPVDIRMSLPMMGNRFYFTVVAGRERRRPARLAADRAAYPLLTAGNALFALGILTLLTLAALAMLIAHSAIIE